MGGCNTTDAKWEIKVNWRDTAPKTCEGHLVVLDQKKNILWLKKYDKSNRALIASREIREIREIPKDLCSIDFLQNQVRNL